MAYWIKERSNPQLGTYFVAIGKASVKEIKNKNSSYGSNQYHKYSTLQEYENRIEELRATGNLW